MTRRRNSNRRYQDQYKDEPEQESQGFTFRQACIYLWEVILLKILPSKYLGHACLYKGRWRKIEGETVEYFFLSDFPKLTFSKSGNKLPIR